jgi:hypothetical protein
MKSERPKSVALREEPSFDDLNRKFWQHKINHYFKRSLNLDSPVPSLIF